MEQRSARSYNQRTLKILWGRAAGRCAVPICRIELFANATDHDPIVVIGEIAHIEASSNSGPRANVKKAAKDRDDYDNLILLCQNCHARLDGQKNTNSVEFIKQLRNDHEAWVRNSLPERGKSISGWVTIILQDSRPIDLESATTALLPDFPSGDPLIIKVDTEKDSWDTIKHKLVAQVDGLFEQGDRFDFRIALFPLASVSACIASGYYLTSRPRVRLFNYHRDEQSWAWPNTPPPPSDIVVSGLPDNTMGTSGELAIVFDLSATVSDILIKEASPILLTIVHVSVTSPNTGWLQHTQQLRELGKITRQVFENCVGCYPKVRKWHIFYAGPAAGAIVVGQQINRTMCPPAQLYEYQHNRTPPYLPSILLSEESNDK